MTSSLIDCPPRFPPPPLPRHTPHHHTQAKQQRQIHDEYERAQREREQLLREADEKCDRLEAEAIENSEASRLRAQRNISERAKMVAERETKRVEEGYYDPHRLGKMQEDRRKRAEMERDKQAAARHESDSIARYLGAQSERDEARSMANERNERLRKERMQRLIEMETDEEINAMAAKDREDLRQWEADTWRRNATAVWKTVTWAWRTVTSKWTAYLAVLVFVALFVVASVEVDNVEHMPPVVRKYQEYGAGDGGGEGGGGFAPAKVLDLVFKSKFTHSTASAGEEGDAAAAAAANTTDADISADISPDASIDASAAGPGTWKTKYKWVSPTRAAGKLLPRFIKSGAANFYKKLNADSEYNTPAGFRAESSYVHGFDIKEIEELGLQVETREGEEYLKHALEPHLAVDDLTEMTVHQKLLMNLVNRGVPLSPPPPRPPPAPPPPPAPWDNPNIKATLKYLRGSHAEPLDFKDDNSAEPIVAPVTRGMAAMLRAHGVMKDGIMKTDPVYLQALALIKNRTASTAEGEADGGGSDFTLNGGGSGMDTGKSLELLYDDGIDPEVAATTGHGMDPASDPTNPAVVAKAKAAAEAAVAEKEAKEAKALEDINAALEKEKAEEAARQAIADAHAARRAEHDELRAAVLGDLTGTTGTVGQGAGGVPLRNGAGVKFNVGGAVLGAAVAAAAASTDSLELAVAKTPVVVAGELGGADGKKKKKKRGH